MPQDDIPRSEGLPQFAGVDDTCKLMFLDAFLETASIKSALQFCGATRPMLMAWRALDESFAFAFDKARTMAAEHLEEEAYRRAFEGVERHVYHQGQQVGSYREYSDTLLVLLLKATYPEKYMDKFAGVVTGDQDVADRLMLGRKRAQELRGNLKAQKQITTKAEVVEEPTGVPEGPEPGSLTTHVLEAHQRLTERAQRSPQMNPGLPIRVVVPGDQETSKEGS